MRLPLPALVVAYCLQPIMATGAPKAILIYVEPFSTKDQSRKLYEELLSAIRKQSEFRPTSSESGAELEIIAAGDTYIKGYVGRNPRIRYLNSNSEAVYGGYLSLELRNRDGDPVWSTLITPRRFGSSDINRNLAEQAAKKLSEAMRSLNLRP